MNDGSRSDVLPCCSALVSFLSSGKSSSNNDRVRSIRWSTFLGRDSDGSCSLVDVDIGFSCDFASSEWEKLEGDSSFRTGGNVFGFGGRMVDAGGDLLESSSGIELRNLADLSCSCDTEPLCVRSSGSLTSSSLKSFSPAGDSGTEVGSRFCLTAMSSDCDFECACIARDLEEFVKKPSRAVCPPHLDDRAGIRGL